MYEISYSYANFLLRFDFSPTDEEIKSVLLQLNNELFVPENFTPTGPKFIPREKPGRAFPIVRKML